VKKIKIKDENIIRKKILEAAEKNEDGINQKDLWKKTRIDSKIGTKVLIKLINEGKISRTLMYVDGKKIYKVHLPRNKLTILPIEEIEGLVCFPCNKIFDDCTEGGTLSPVNCPKLNEWLEKQ
jgi:hypothetical protein